MSETWAVVLAAGLSSRMGTQKMLLPYGESTIVETVVGQIGKSGIENIVVVLGADHELISEKLAGYPVKLAVNERFRDGMHTSVMKGVGAIPDGEGFVLIFLGDQPQIESRVIRQVIEAAKSSGKGIVIPLFNGKRGHPPLYHLKYRSELVNLSVTSGLRAVAQTFQEDVFEVETRCPEILRDIDTPADYQNEIHKTKKHG